MSKKVSQYAAQALQNGLRYSNGKNTKVSEGKLYLHGNCIAEAMGDATLIRNRGWFTLTTKDRLNAISGVSIYQKRGVWYLRDGANHVEWDGDDIIVRWDGTIEGKPVQF
jgi:hypothetical protein